MTAKTPAERKRTEREKRKTLGLTRLEIWAKPEHHEQIKAFALKLSKGPNASSER